MLGNRMQVIGEPSEKKRDHDKAFGNLHHWTLIVAAPIKRKKIEVRAGARIVEMNTDQSWVFKA